MADGDDLELIEAELAALPLAGVPGLAEAMRYSLLAGGKRIRPRLCLAAARAAGGDPRRALPAAAAVELVHTFSLVHDDLPALDDDDLRRGRPTSHVRFGEGIAVLAGDALLTTAFAVVSDRLDAPAEVRVAVTAELAAGVSGMIDGQYLDVTADGGLDGEALAAMHRLKTGALIGAAVGIGLNVAGAPAAAQAPYRAFAAELGLLFQIVDDVLDATGSPAELGKPAGADAARGRRTYVTVHGLDAARRLAGEALARAQGHLDAAAGDPSELRALAAAVGGRAV